MYKPLFFLIALFWVPFALSKQVKIHRSKADDRKFLVKINHNVELLGFVYFLGYEGAQSETATYSARTRARYAYGIDLYRQYKAYENSKNLAVAVGFAQDIWLDYFINLLVQLDDFPNARLNKTIDTRYYARFSAKGDTADARKNASAFIEAMNQLYEEVDFGSYLIQNQAKYENAINQVSAGLPDSLFIPAMQGFYQGHLDSYTMTPSLTIPPGMGFGVKYTADHKTHAFHVFGAFKLPNFKDSSKLDMGFNDKKHLLELSTHEFGHSFVNPVIDELPAGVITQTQKLFDPVKEAMADQGYTTWKACLYEHFVRAGEIIIAQNLGNAADAQRLRKHYGQDRKFIYLPILLPELEAYNTKRTGSYKEAVRSAMKKLLEEAAKHQ